MPSRIHPDELERRIRFMASLPWHVNGTLPADQRAWMQQLIDSAGWAGTAYAAERGLAAAVGESVEEAPETGLEDLLSRVRAEHASSSGRSRERAASGPPILSDIYKFLVSLLESLAQPKAAMAMAALVVAQAGLLGYVSVRDLGETDSVRSMSGDSPRLIRVRALPGVSEDAFRTALRKAGVSIRHGPDQLGDYFVVPGDTTSQDEALDALRTAGVFGVVAGAR